MQANEFEKQVQKQLDDFQLNPSASVWKKVEEEIRKKKRRRAIIFFVLPVVLALMSYSVYYFLNTSKETELSQQPVAAKNEKSPVNDKGNASIETKERQLAPQLEESDKPGVLTEKKIAQKKNTTDGGNNELQISLHNPATGRMKNKPVVKHTDEVTTVEKKQNVSPVINNNVSEKQELSITIDKPETGLIAKNKITENTGQETNDQKNKVVITAKDVVAEKTDSTKTGEVIKIKWGIDFSAGITSSQSSVFALSFSENKSLDAAFSNNSTSSGGSQTIVTVPPSAIRPAPAFRIGLIGELQVSERIRFSVGLQYAYASNRIMTGAATDTSFPLRSNNNYTMVVDQVYRGPHQSSYTNRYHFVSIPLSYHWQINKSKKLPIQWNLGVSISYLLATNALVYSSSYGGIYYHDKNAFNKMHFNMGTGLSSRLTGKKGMEWVLGPELSFDTRKLVSNGYDKKQYLLFGGINAKLFLPKKKK